MTDLTVHLSDGLYYCVWLFWKSAIEPETTVRGGITTFRKRDTTGSFQCVSRHFQALFVETSRDNSKPI